MKDTWFGGSFSAEIISNSTESIFHFLITGFLIDDLGFSADPSLYVLGTCFTGSSPISTVLYSSLIVNILRQSVFYVSFLEYLSRNCNWDE